MLTLLLMKLTSSLRWVLIGMALSMCRPLVSWTLRREVMALVRCDGLLTLVRAVSSLGGIPWPIPVHRLKIVSSDPVVVLILCAVVLAGLVIGLVLVMSILLCLVTVFIPVWCRFLISIPMALLGRCSNRSIRVSALIGRRLLLVGLLTLGSCRVMSRTRPLFRTVWLRVCTDPLWLMKSGMITAGQMMMLCSGSIGSLAVGAAWVGLVTVLVLVRVGGLFGGLTTFQRGLCVANVIGGMVNIDAFGRYFVGIWFGYGCVVTLWWCVAVVLLSCRRLCMDWMRCRRLFC